MSETPRTDTRVFDADLVSASFARELERENIELRRLLGRMLCAVEGQKDVTKNESIALGLQRRAARKFLFPMKPNA